MSNDTGEAVEVRCPRCGSLGTLKGIRVRTWFTIFFCPVFPISGGQRMTQCMKCNASFAMAPEQFAGAAARADAIQTRRAISMYNSLRSSPANSVTLNELMQLYGLMGEFSQAISAATDFPAALNNSEQCMVTLGRAHLSQNDFPGALYWLETALQRNSDLPEAHYFKALSCLNMAPPDLERAAIAAKAARKSDYPGADDLIGEIEAKLAGPDAG